MVLTGSVVPAAGVSSARSLRLHGAITMGFAGPESKSGSLTLSHAELSSR
jgi:hypothetical protein